MGALPGVNSSNSTRINSRGWIAGISQNGVIDPLVSIPEIRAVLWKDNETTDLGTLGGTESFAIGMNNGGQVVGVATNTVPDPFPFLGFGTQVRAFLWENPLSRSYAGGRVGQAVPLRRRFSSASFKDITSAFWLPRQVVVTVGAPRT